jgi:hypothetical protein
VDGPASDIMSWYWLFARSNLGSGLAVLRESARGFLVKSSDPHRLRRYTADTDSLFTVVLIILAVYRGLARCPTECLNPLSKA